MNWSRHTTVKVIMIVWCLLGGKDSTWTLYYLMKEYGLKPLVVRFDHGFLRPNLNDNTTKVLRELEPI